MTSEMTEKDGSLVRANWHLDATGSCDCRRPAEVCCCRTTNIPRLMRNGWRPEIVDADDGIWLCLLTRRANSSS